MFEETFKVFKKETEAEVSKLFEQLLSQIFTAVGIDFNMVWKLFHHPQFPEFFKTFDWSKFSNFQEFSNFFRA